MICLQAGDSGTSWYGSSPNPMAQGPRSEWFKSQSDSKGLRPRVPTSESRREVSQLNTGHKLNIPSQARSRAQPFGWESSFGWTPGCDVGFHCVCSVLPPAYQNYVYEMQSCCCRSRQFVQFH